MANESKSFEGSSTGRMLRNQIITLEDLYEFRTLLLKDFKELLQSKPAHAKQWLKSTEVRKMLNISPGTLQTLRITKTLSYTKIGGIIYYAHQDIEKLLENNKVTSERTLFNSK